MELISNMLLLFFNALFIFLFVLILRTILHIIYKMIINMKKQYVVFDLVSQTYLSRFSHTIGSNDMWNYSVFAAIYFDTKEQCYDFVINHKDKFNSKKLNILEIWH